MNQKPCVFPGIDDIVDINSNSPERNIPRGDAGRARMPSKEETYAIAEGPQVAVALALAVPGSKDVVRWRACAVSNPCPGELLQNTLRALRPGGEFEVFLMPDVSGFQVSAGWALRWLEDLPRWQLERRTDGTITLCGVKA